jgi:hypothetical protein
MAEMPRATVAIGFRDGLFQFHSAENRARALETAHITNPRGNRPILIQDRVSHIRYSTDRLQLLFYAPALAFFGDFLHDFEPPSSL